MLGQDPEHQLVHLREFARSRGYEIVGEFVDKGISGSRERRPALDEMLKQAKLRTFQLIIICALDRLGRDTKHMLNLIDELKGSKVTISSLREGIEFDSPIGTMMLTVISSIAQLERSLISERIKNALAAKKIAAQQSGSGWRCGPPLKVTDKIQAEVLRLRAEGKSVRAIAKTVDIGKTSVLRILKAGPRPLPIRDTEPMENTGGKKLISRLADAGEPDPD